MALRAGGGPLVLQRDLGVPGPVQGQRAFGAPLYGARLASPVAGTVLLRAGDGALSLRLATAGSQSLALPFLASGAVLYAPTVSLAGGAAQSLGVPFLSAGNVLFAPVVAPGAVVLGLPFLATGAVLYVPLVAPGAVALALPFIASGNLLFSPFVTLPAVPPAERVALVAALARAARVEGVPRIGAPGASARIILIK